MAAILEKNKGVLRTAEAVAAGISRTYFGFTYYPLSLAIDFSVYATAGGAVIEIWTVDENGHDDIVVYAWIGNEWVEVGRVPGAEVVGYDSNRYVVYTDQLAAGSSYRFRVIDECGYTHTSPQPIEVRVIRVEAVRLDMQTMELRFNTEAGRMYQLMVSTDLVRWTNEFVQIEGPNGWLPLSNKPFIAGNGTRTSVRVPVNGRSRAFFKAVKVK